MSAEIKSGTESCKSTIEHETAGILRCQGLHQRQAFPTVHGNGQHGWDDSDPRIIPPTPWRFDVPEVTPRVTCVRQAPDGEVFVRNPHDNAYWASWTARPTRWLSTAELLAYAPLVECPDPRAAS